MATVQMGMDWVHHNFFPQAFIDEKLGLASMTLNMIPDGLRQWLARKGFRTREEILEFVGLAGSSLPTALHLLLSSLPKNQCGRYKHACSNRKKPCEPGPGYSRDLLDKVRKLTNRNIQAMLKETGLEFEIYDNYQEVGRLQIPRRQSPPQVKGFKELAEEDIQFTEGKDAENEESDELLEREISPDSVSNAQINIVESENISTAIPCQQTGLSVPGYEDSEI